METPRKVGRPTKYDDTWSQKLEEAMAKGWTVEMFCNKTRIAWSTFYEWVKKYPEFSQAFAEGKKDAEGFHQFYIMENFENKNLQVAGVKLFMQNCFGWSEKRETDMNLTQKENTERAVRRADENNK